MTKPLRFGVPTGRTSCRVARTLLALHVAGERGILLPDLVERVGCSRATLYRMLDVVRAAGWRIDTERELGYARISLSSWQRLPKCQPVAPDTNRSRRVNL